MSGLFDSLREFQPLSHALLTETDTQLLVGYHAFFSVGPPLDGHNLSSMAVLAVKDRVIKLNHYYTGSPGSAGIDGFLGNPLPNMVLRTWWYRMAGYQIARRLPTSIHEWAQPLLQTPSCGTGVNHIVAAMGTAAKRKYMPLLKEMFGLDAVTKVYQTGRVAFLCILDTRPPETVATACGDQPLCTWLARTKPFTTYAPAVSIK